MNKLKTLSKTFKGGYWNYRFIKHSSPYNELDDNLQPTGKIEYEVWYTLHEVYYDKKDKIISWTTNPITFSIDNVYNLLDLSAKAFEASKKYVLEEKDGKLVELDEFMEVYYGQ